MTRVQRYSLLRFLTEKTKKLLSYLRKTDENRLDYINGIQTLPPPLSKEEEPVVLEMLSQDPARARELLITRNLRLVVYIARKFESAGPDIEDLISIGTIGLIKAVGTFSPDKKIKLATYASRCIENEILMHLRKTAKLKAEVSFDEPLNTDWDGNELLLSDVLGTEEDCIRKEMETEAEHEALRQAVARLSSREQNIMELRFGLNGKREHTQKEVSELIGISQSYISRLEKRILKKLADELREDFSD
ncbi:MAG: RNA polymerase sporulation sigma factor SigE [Oscillospiraceae bacterium]|nr:RNA polymerase sporulation sigma factor SigE [Oscillospiraceae bacterium]